ncbi:MAG: FAD-binding protein, partial [Bacteroidetes bacterium]|nr:FAD-binding protein [Bacteroidota bacterium]
MSVKACLEHLKAILPGSVRDDDYMRALYSTDASIYQVTPLAVVVPRHRDEVQAVMEAAHQFGVPVTARSAGSSLAGQAINRSIMVDFTKHLDSIIDFDPVGKTVTVEPGVVLDRLNAYLKPHGLLFGPDPASSNRAAMGGIISNNATGSHSICYGMSADHVDSMDVLLADGTRAHFSNLTAEEFKRNAARPGLEGQIYAGLSGLIGNEENLRIIQEHTPRHWRRSGGYNLDRLVQEGLSFRMPQPEGLNLARMVSGAEGTLAVIEKLKLGLVPLPKKTALAVVHFEDVGRALESVQVLLEQDPSAVELLDYLGLSMCRQSPMWRRKLETFVEGEPNCVLLTEFQGESDLELAHKVEEFIAFVRRRGVGAGAIVPVLTAAGQADVWNVRKMGLGFLMSVRGDHKPIPFIEDAAVPVEHLAEYVTTVEKFCNSLGLKVAYYAHASAGCIHIRPIVNTKSARELALLPEIGAFSISLLKGFGGSLSSEHGDGRARSSFNKMFFGDELYGLYTQTKSIFDPKGILNPGMVTGAAPMTEDMRHGPTYRTMKLKTNLDFSDELGYAAAVEMCNGAGVCKKVDSGTMCPSYMATKEEEHSTRGRANALRNVLSGNLAASELHGKRLYETMDLCLQCKACASECPSSVDLAKIKVEFLDQYYKVNGTPLRAKFFAGVAAQSRRFSGRTAPLINRLSSGKAAKWALEKVMGVSRHRSLPPFAKVPFDQWFKSRPKGQTTAKEPIVLFNDTFNTYNYPEVAIAATLVLEAAGFEVILPGHRCCGRPQISKGLIDEARQSASETLDSLMPYVQKGMTVVGLEPSCVLSFGDE